MKVPMKIIPMVTSKGRAASTLVRWKTADFWSAVANTLHA